MSDSPDTRSRNGSKDDRKVSTANAAATGAGASLAIGAADLMIQCYQGGHFHWVAPNQQLVEMAAPILLLPVGLWLARVLSLIGTIITNRLQRDAAT